MSEDLRLSLNIAGGGRRVGANTGSIQSENFALGSGDWPKLGMNLAFGTSAVPTAQGLGYANAWFVDKRTCNAAGSDNLDLTALTDNIGETFNFAKVKLILVALSTTPDGVKLLKVGPQNVANAFQGSFGGGGATVYKSVYDWEIIEWNRWAGFTVDGTHKIVGISNPGAGNIDYLVAIMGIKV